MADLLEYFEARSRSLDDEGHPVLDASTLQFISLIRFNGIPILPPVLTESKRQEMQTYRHAAVKIESRTRAKRREDMHSKVQSIVAGVEERRAAKSARKLSPSGSSKLSVSKEKTSTVTRLSGTKSFTESGKNIPPEILINVPVSKQSDKPKSSKPSSASSPVSGSSKSKSSPSNYKSLAKLGTLNKHKSLSSQHLDRTSTILNQSKQEADYGHAFRHKTTKGLFPHPPAGHPPSRGSTLRQSASTPDLRSIEVNVKTEDLKKPLPSRSLSPKGGRPQTQDQVKDSPKHRDVEKKRENDSVCKSSKQNLEKTQKETMSIESNYSKRETKVDVEVNKSKLANSCKPAKDTKALHNPLETLEKELVRQEEAERSQKLTKFDVRQDLDPIQTAAAELFPYPISEEEALATLDSLQADFASLEQMDSLPDDYNGIPLTSSKEKQIIHMLTKLSKALNIEDTLASTTGSNASHVQNSREPRQEQGASGNFHKTATIGANKVEHSSGEPNEHVDMFDDGFVNVTNDSSVTGHSSGSGINTSASSRGRMSPTGSSILSSASSVGASRSRMSPKSLKNTVHFSSFVTEISTSASQSYEDKISIRKLDITPKNSENFEEGESLESKNENSSRSCLGPGTSQSSGSLLHKVALSPSIDTPSGSPGEYHGQDFPLDQGGISQDGELNTSDKENEFTPSLQSSSNDSYQHSRSSRNPQVLNVYTANIPEGPIGENHPAVFKTSIKSDFSENSTLKGSQEKALTHENLAMYSKLLEPQNYYNAGIRDLDIYTHGTNSSTSSMQEEITRSYLLQQQRSDKDLSNGRSVKNKQEITLGSSDGVSVVLQPVLPNNFQNSLNENRSMLENEEEIRSNLQRVLLEDSDDDCSERENIYNKQQDIVDDYAVKSEHFSAGEEKLNEEVSKIGTENDVDHFEKCHIKIEADDDKEVDAADTELVKDQPAEEQYNDNKDEMQDRTEIKVQNEHEEIEGAEEEEEGKAEHIQKYLIHVHEQSMQHEDDPGDSDTDDVKADGNFDITSLIQTFTSTLQSMNHLSQEDLFRIQAEQFELLQKKLIEQQRAQLEELFVSQRREQLALEKEIESYQTTMQGYDQIETIPLPDTQRAPLIASIPDVSPAWQYTNQPPVQNPHPNPTLSPPFPIQPVPSVPYPQNINTSVLSHNTSYSTIPYSDIHTTVPFQHVQGQGHMFQGQQLDHGYSRISHAVEHDTVPAQKTGVPSMAQNKKTDKNPPKATKKRSANQQSVQAKNPYIYPTSPSLCQNPAERDDQSDVSSFVRATPRQLVFSNQSTPVPMPKMSTRQPVMHSPAKKPSQAWTVGKPSIPEKVFDPRMKPKFDRVSAAVKGYLTRRLLKTHKVQEIIKTINDTRNFAFSFQAETPIKQGTFSREDRGLLERIVAQLQAALLDIHEIFFVIPVSERMVIISTSRLKERDQYLRESKRSSVSVSQSQPRLSKATLKALERKKKAQLAEEAVFGSTEFRPRSAPPNTSSPHPSTDIRALRPLQGQISPIRPDSQVTVREIKDRPKSAGDRAKQKTTSSNKDTSKTKKSSGTKSTKSASGVSQSSKQQKSTTANTRSKKMDKAWR